MTAGSAGGEAGSWRLAALAGFIEEKPVALVVMVGTLASSIFACIFCYSLYAIFAPQFFYLVLPLAMPIAAPLVTAPPFYLILVLIIRRLSEARHQLSVKQQELERQVAEIEAVSEQLRVARLASEEAAHAKSLFLASMSHELRTPLNAIIGFSESMLAEIDGPVGSQRYRGYLGDIESAGRHLLALVNDILDLSKIEAGKLTIELSRFHLPEVFDEAARLLRSGFEGGAVRLRSEIDDEVAWTLADRRALLQILLNLLSNALRYTPRDGEVVVRAKPEGEGWRLEVEDSGSGIDPKEIARVQQPFERIEGPGLAGGGTGLGLTLVKGLTELHGGAMEIASAPGQGTCVSLSFPRRLEVAVS